MGEPVLRELLPEEWPGYFRGMQPLWGGGLAEEPFVAYQRRLACSPEAVGRYRLLGWMDSGELLSAFKAYELRGLADDGPARAPLRVLGVGAVFTPPPLRRRGHASAMLRQALALPASAGFDAALLFSDVGAPLYERLGFRLLDSTECLVDPARLPRTVGARPTAPGDESAVTGLLAAGRVRAGLQLSRDGWVLRFQLRRLRELARARNVGEPEWGLYADSRAGRGCALLRLSRDAVDVLDAAWTSEEARAMIFAGLRACCERSRRERLRLWPSHQLRGLYPELPRPNALSMIASLREGAPLPAAGAKVELALLDHI